MRECKICGRTEAAQLVDCPDCGNELPPIPPIVTPTIKRNLTLPIWLVLIAVCGLTVIVIGKERMPKPEAPAVAAPAPAVEAPRPVIYPPKPTESESNRIPALRDAAMKGDADAQCQLAALYVSGDGILIDLQEALGWYRMAADQGNVVAQLELGKIFEEGLGVAKDSYEALKWYRRAAAGGNSEARAATKRLGG